MTMQDTMVGALALAVTLMTNACSSSTPEAEVPAQAAQSSAPVAREQPEPEPAEPSESEEVAGDEAATSADDAVPAQILLEADGDLDGAAGDEHLVLRTDGTLTAGDWRGTAEIPTTDEYWIGEQAALGVVVLDRRAGTRAVLVSLPIQEEEDPPNRYQLFVHDGAEGLRRVLDITIGAYGARPLTFPGNGTARYDEDGWTACDRLNHPARAPRQRITLAMDGDVMVESGRRNTGQVQRCDQLAACPFVYLLGEDGEPRLVGEILRNLRGRSSYAAQTLALPGPDHGGLRVRLAEEKPEVTYLDEVYLAIDGIRIPPRSCTGASPRPAYCLADGEHHVMREGETLDLVFDASTPDAVLHATGYYVPTGQ